LKKVFSEVALRLYKKQSKIPQLSKQKKLPTRFPLERGAGGRTQRNVLIINKLRVFPLPTPSQGGNFARFAKCSVLKKVFSFYLCSIFL
jgi:hypothetical protein